MEIKTMQNILDTTMLLILWISAFAGHKVMKKDTAGNCKTVSRICDIYMHISHGFRSSLPISRLSCSNKGRINIATRKRLQYRKCNH